MLEITKYKKSHKTVNRIMILTLNLRLIIIRAVKIYKL